MAKHTKYGFCPLIKRWIPRDDMLAINVKMFDEDNEETKVKIRVSQEGFDVFAKYVETIEWRDEMKEEHELLAEGIPFRPVEQRDSVC